MSDTEIIQDVKELRADASILSGEVRDLINHSVFDGEQTAVGQHSEMKANIMLAYRHLEDARMRLGKVIQAYDGGTSCYPS